MKNILYTVFLLLIISFVLAGCSSAPKTVPEAPVEQAPVPVEPVPPVESVQPVVPQKPVVDFEKLHADLSAEIDTMRQRLIENGVKEALPAQFEQAEKLRQSYFDMRSSSADQDAALQRGKLVLTQYKTLEYALESVLIANEIDSFSLAQYSRSEYDRALASLVKADELFLEEGNEEAAYIEAQGAVALFNTVREKGYQSIVEIERTKAESAKKDCDEQRAMNAVKVPYAAALAIYNTGIKQTQEKKYKDAYQSFLDAEKAFKNVYGEAVAKKEKALQALADAQKRIDEADEKAKHADTVAPISDDDATSMAEMQTITEEGDIQ